MNFSTASLACPAFLALASSAVALQASTIRVSVSSSGVQANGPSYYPAISADGRFVAFNSVASTLVSGDTNNDHDVFVYDRQNGTTERVSVATAGTQGNLGSSSPDLSADGRFVAFHSNSSNFVAGDTNGTHDIFVRDRQNGTTERVNLSSAGAQANDQSVDCSLSADGRFVAFKSIATNLVAGDTNGSADVFVRDRLTGTTERVSVATGGVQANGSSFWPWISGDGRYVAFKSVASDLVPGDTNANTDDFVHDRQTGVTERVNVDSAGNQGNQPNAFGVRPSISADGRFVVFESYSTNLVPADTNGVSDVFVRDRQLGTTERISVTTGGAQGDGDSVYPSISADGRFVVYLSGASNLVAGDTNAADDIFVRDRLLATTERFSVASSGAEANGRSREHSAMAAGRFVAFQSLASNLVAGDTNNQRDIFLRDLGSSLLGTSYCVAAPNSTGNPASLGATGNPTATQNDVTLMCTELPPNAFSFFLTSQTQGLVTNPGGSQGDLCLGGSIGRYVAPGQIQNSGAAGAVALALDLTQHPTSTGLVTVTAGQTWNFQCWYRDANPTVTSNFSNGLQIDFH